MVAVKFVGPEAVEIDLRGVDVDNPSRRQVVNPGDVIEVSDEIAHGTPGTPVVTDDGDPVVNPDTGEPEVVGRYGGLLDQPAKWQAVPIKKTAAKTAATKED